jgi:hypothetical protein
MRQDNSELAGWKPAPNRLALWGGLEANKHPADATPCAGTANRKAEPFAVSRQGVRNTRDVRLAEAANMPVHWSALVPEAGIPAGMFVFILFRASFGSLSHRARTVCEASSGRQQRTPDGERQKVDGERPTEPAGSRRYNVLGFPTRSACRDFIGAAGGGAGRGEGRAIRRISFIPP